MITVTVVRHGESTDNAKALWAGWKDAPLSNHGMNQAKALGAAFADTKIDAIYASPLKRALWTAQQVEEQNHSRPPLATSRLLMEQHYGAAEGQAFGSREFVRLPGREFKFREGESVSDVRKRAAKFVEEYLDPVLAEQQGELPSSRHIVIVAHGTYNFELLGALQSRTPEGISQHWGYRSMSNTGWTRLELGLLGEIPCDKTPIRFGPQNPHPLIVNVLCYDVIGHLHGLRRQGGGIGSSAHDAKQQSIRAYFGGAGAAE